MNAAVWVAFDALPTGSFLGTADGRRYVVSKSAVAGKRGWKLVAEELGGTDYISANVYSLGTGKRLYPCEMPVEKVTRFILSLTPAQ